MITLTLTRGEFEEIYDAVRDLPDIYRSELKENGDEPDAAHIDLFNAVQKLEKINESNNELLINGISIFKTVGINMLCDHVHIVLTHQID